MNAHERNALRANTMWIFLGNIAWWGLVAWTIFAWRAGSAWWAVLLMFLVAHHPIGIAIGFVLWWKLGWTGFIYLVLTFVSQCGHLATKEVVYRRWA